MPGRLTPLINGEFYHIFNRGSEKRDIFIQPRDYFRFLQTTRFYQVQNPRVKFSNFAKYKLKSLETSDVTKIVEIICYCLMPNHFHFLLRQTKEKGISIFLSQISNSYTKYFNTKYKRIGPLLQGAFKSVRVEDEKQLLHVSRYIHLNPVVSGLVNSLYDYKWSSYSEYVGQDFLCSTNEILDFFSPKHRYKQFLEDQIDYGISLEQIKHQIIE